MDTKKPVTENQTEQNVGYGKTQLSVHATILTLITANLCVISLLYLVDRLF